MPSLYQNIIRNQYVLEEGRIEWILVNDSPDHKMELPINDRIVIKTAVHAKNSGIHQARITGLQMAEGKYVLFLDQDDEIADDYVRKELALIKDNEMIICNAYEENEDGSRRKLYRSSFKWGMITNLEPYIKKCNQIISPGQCLILRSSIPKEWKENIIHKNGSDDLYLWILLLSKGAKITTNDECLYVHKYTGDNVSEDLRKMEHSTLEIVDVLSKSPYVSERTIHYIRKSRSFKMKFERMRAMQKLGFMLASSDILLPKVYWKIREMLNI